MRLRGSTSHHTLFMVKKVGTKVSTTMYTGVSGSHPGVVTAPVYIGIPVTIVTVGSDVKSKVTASPSASPVVRVKLV